MRKICVITGSRAEFGLLSGLMHAINKEEHLQLQIIVTNMHLSPEFGLTYKEIEQEGFYINKKVVMLLSSDTANATAKSMGLGMIGFADAYEDLQPDLLVVLGDRYEILAAVAAALPYKIPIAHLHGGELTEGAYDDSIRHAVTKMSHLHFTATEEYRNRVIQLGEQPDRIFNVGSLGVQNSKEIPFLTKEELEKEIVFRLGDKSLLVTFHPETLETVSPQTQSRNLLDALSDFPDYRIVFTMPNSDTNGRIIMDQIKQFVEEHKGRAIYFQSLGKIRYLSMIRFVSAVIGNSSSGIIEVPSFGIPTLNIGNRQKGRIMSKTVFNCGITHEEIRNGIKEVLSEEMRQLSKEAKNPYEKDNTINNIIRVLKSYPLDGVIRKSFYNLK